MMVHRSANNDRYLPSGRHSYTRNKASVSFFISTLKQIYETCDGYDNADKNDFSIFFITIKQIISKCQGLRFHFRLTEDSSRAKYP
jgi:hypothetical protein